MNLNKIKNFIQYAPRIGLLILFIFSAFQFSVAQDNNTTKANRAYKEAAKDFHRLYEDTSFRDYEANWQKTIKKFHDIYLNYPYTIRAIQALYNIGKLYRSLYKWNKKRDYINRSNKNFQLLVKRYKESYLADDALYEIGLNYKEVLNDSKKAQIYFKRLLENYPDSEYVDSAQIYTGKTVVSLDDSMEKKPGSTINSPGETFATGIEDTKTRQKIIVKPDSNTVYGRAVVKQIDRWTTPDWSRVVVVTNKPAQYKYNTLTIDAANPRFYVDILKTSLTPGLSNKIIANDGIIKQLRVAQFDKDTVRVVLDLENYSNIKIFTFEFSDSFKIVLDVLSISPKSGKGRIVATNTPQNKPLTKPNQTSPPSVSQTPLPNSNLSLQKILGLKIDRIIIDPGHGGRDPGAKNGKYLEKNITLKLALILKKLLEQKLENIEVLLTRERDIFIPLEARTAFANKNKGDMFISLHVNSHSERSARGIETYFLNLTDDKDSLQLAALENKSSVKNVSDLQSILNDLMINNKLKESHGLGQEVNNKMYSYIIKKARTKISNRGVKQAPFVVLLGANMPSILIEIGFISNPTDLKNLRSKKYLEYLAEGIYRGINSYISKFAQ